MTNKKHEHIRDAILADIQALRFTDGKIPTESELCARFQVSRPTVARALHDLVRLGLVERRTRAGTRVRAPDPGPRLGLLLPGLGTTEILDPVIGALSTAVQARQGEVVMGGTDPRSNDAQALLAPILARAATGVVFAPLEQTADRHQTNAAILTLLDQAGIPVVLFDREAGPFAAAGAHDLVAIDHWQAAFTLGSHLADRGCRTVAFVPRTPLPSSSELRLAGLREALARSGGTVTSIPCADPETTAAACVGYDAIACVNDLTAAHLLPALAARGIRVPADVRVTGFDDVAFAALLQVPLTTVRQPYTDLAEAAIATLIERIAQPQRPMRRVLLPATLVVRASTGA